VSDFEKEGFVPPSKTGTFKSAVSNVFTHVGERMAFLLDHVRHHQIPSQNVDVKQSRHIPTPLSCAGYRSGLQRSKSLDSLEKSGGQTRSCVPIWHAPNSVKTT